MQLAWTFLDELGSNNVLKSMSCEWTVVMYKEPWGWRAAWDPRTLGHSFTYKSGNCYWAPVMCEGLCK